MTAPRTAPRPDAGPTAERDGVTVAVDGTDAGLRAVRWAVREAAARRAGLTILHAAPYAVGSTGSLHAHAWRILARARAIAHQYGPRVPARTLLLEAEPLAALVATSQETCRLGALLVVGLAGTGQPTDALVGSLALDLASRACGPVVVVPRAGRASGPVVAAVGDPAGDLVVLHQAHRAAARRGAGLEVLHAARTPTEAAAARDALERVLRTLDTAEPGVPTTVRVMREPKYEAVVAHSDRASLLVVGTGRGRRHLLGSTTRTAIRLAGCPVLVAVPEPEGPTDL
ncbi:universal stress protein [Pseudonocardia kujensis]|uniref:universal stress protein n=1 Tax=Pseudonocardia kujensis TaxID=1128675 RepID=UPI001E525FE1|nr:universal stress protein [Pseudonocardia kujensis]MCE0766233.1 universal stress protein [Pseudonocardia kujensis]